MKQFVEWHRNASSDTPVLQFLCVLILMADNSYNLFTVIRTWLLLYWYSRISIANRRPLVQYQHILHVRMYYLGLKENTTNLIKILFNVMLKPMVIKYCTVLFFHLFVQPGNDEWIQTACRMTSGLRTSTPKKSSIKLCGRFMVMLS